MSSPTLQDLQTHADETGTLLNSHLLHLESDVSALGRKFDEIDHGWLEHGMGHPESANEVGRDHFVRPCPEKFLLGALFDGPGND